MNKKLVFLKICRRLGLFRLSQWLYRRKLLILCYHGFELQDESAWWPGVFIPREKLHARMDLLRSRGFHVLPLEEALRRMYERRLPANTAVITADDGYRSTHSIFLPVLREFDYPATVYVTTYYVEKQVPIFRLAVQYMFWKTSRTQLRPADRPWGRDAGVVVDLCDPGQARTASRAIIEYGDRLASETQRQEILAELGELLDVDYQAIVAGQAFTLMNWDEIRELSRAGIDIQLHTHRHRFPNDRDVAVREVADNAGRLAAHVDTPLRHFCYPSGIWYPEQGPWLEAIGITSATTCHIGFNDAGTNPYRLMRYLDRADIAEDEFLAEICGFSPLLRLCRKSLTLSGRRNRTAGPAAAG